MSFKSHTSQADPNSKSNSQQLHPPVRASSPCMFDESMVSFEVLSQFHQTFGYNRVISNQATQPSASVNSKILSIPPVTYNPSIFPLTPTSLRMDAAVLSFSQIERVTTCRLCDQETQLNQCTDSHNRSITEVTQNVLYSEDYCVGSVPGSSPKRLRLDEPTDDSLTLNLSWTKVSAETSHLLQRLHDSTKAINDQLVSLHSDW